MPSFFYICEYLGVTPQEFFDEGNANPEAYSLQCGYTISRKVGISHFKTLIQYPYAQNKGMMNPPYHPYRSVVSYVLSLHRSTASPPETPPRYGAAVVTLPLWHCYVRQTRWQGRHLMKNAGAYIPRPYRSVIADFSV